MGAFKYLIFSMKHGSDGDLEELMKSREETRAEIKKLIKKKREVEVRIEQLLVSREEARRKLEQQMEIGKTCNKEKSRKTGEKTDTLERAGTLEKIKIWTLIRTGFSGKTGIPGIKNPIRQKKGKQETKDKEENQEARIGKKIPGKEEENNPEIWKTAEKKKELFTQSETEEPEKDIDPEVAEVTELMEKTIAEAEMEAGVEKGVKTGIKTGVKTGIKTGVKSELEGNKSPIVKVDKYAAFFSNQNFPEKENDSEKTKDEKEKDTKPKASFFGNDLLEELLNDDTLNVEEERNILKFIEDTSTEELIRDLKNVREQLWETSS